MSEPETNRVYWFAETESPPARYLVRGEPGTPAHLTADPLLAARFDDKSECLAACLNNAVRALIAEPLAPVEHMFMGQPK